MADLYHLLDELDEHTDDVIKERRLTAETAATEESEEWDSPDNVEVPLALQEAQKKQQQSPGDYDEDTGVLEETQHVENELCSRLHHHWSQERNCPELLEYDQAMVEDLKAHFEERQEWIDQLEGSSESVDGLMATLAQLDLDRVKFVLSDWLSRRLDKIEAHPLYMREKLDHMSDAELEYLKQFGALFEHHLRQTVLDHIPEAWQSLDEPSMIAKPDYDAYHFWLIKEKIDDGEMEHEEGTCLVAKYKDMREHMREQKVELQL
jgi:hypothetical protein